MAELPPSPDKGAEQGMSNSNPKSHPQGSIPIPIPNPTSATRYKPYGTESYFVEFGPYGCGYQRVQPPQLQVNKTEFMSNKTTLDAVQAQISVFSLVRRGTGVFHPHCSGHPSVHNNKSNKNRGLMARRTKEQRAEVTHRNQRSRNASKVNNGLIKKEECETPADMGLPKEWTY